MINTGKFCAPVYKTRDIRYTRPKFNTFVYVGECRIDRADMTEAEEAGC
jgi:hypothetical protein